MSVLRGEIVTALKQATSVHVHASDLPGKNQTISFDLAMTRSGNFSGTMSENRATFKVLVRKNHFYFKLTASLIRSLNAPSALCSFMCGKWLTLAPKEAKGFTSAVTWPHLFGSFTSGLSTYALKYRGRATVDGQPAWKLVSSDGTRVFVAAQGTPYPLKILPPPGVAGQADFAEWDSATIAPAPPASEVVNLSQLSG